jgi:hypothetical protein
MGLEQTLSYRMPPKKESMTLADKESYRHRRLASLSRRKITAPNRLHKKYAAISTLLPLTSFNKYFSSKVMTAIRRL